jgi:ATP-binding cassette, subfamily C, bacterial CydCD
VRTRAARARLAALERLTPAVIEPADPVVVAARFDVRLEKVTTGWTDEPVLSGVDLRLATGGSLGIVGPSGCGKSTLAALLVRHLEPSRGSYLLGGQDTRRAGSDEVRRHVGLVDDDPYVFASSVRENLRLAAPDADDRTLVAAVHEAGLTDWYDALPHALDTLLGDGATGVSGGERARIGIARAVLADPDVLVLDEPTAHLDTRTARAVTDTILARSVGRSLVWITHDGMGLDQLDRVLTLPGAGPSGSLERARADR